MFTYNAFVKRVIDGDTIDCEVDVGFSIKVHQRFRLYGIDTPEIRGPQREEGLAVKQFVVDMIEGKMIELTSIKTTDKYGRYLAEVNINGVNLNDLLLETNRATVYKL